MGRDSWRGGTETARSRAPAPHRWVKLLLPPPAPAAGYESSASAAAVSNMAARLSARRSASGETVTGGTVTHDGKDIGKTHKHTGVTPGGALTGVPA